LSVISQESFPKKYSENPPSVILWDYPDLLSS
jgi:hypothetical protein